MLLNQNLSEDLQFRNVISPLQCGFCGAIYKNRPKKRQLTGIQDQKEP
jgi:hypothetical protein